jgi:hypothetical protein
MEALGKKIVKAIPKEYEKRGQKVPENMEVPDSARKDVGDLARATIIKKAGIKDGTRQEDAAKAVGKAAHADPTIVIGAADSAVDEVLGKGKAESQPKIWTPGQK